MKILMISSDRKIFEENSAVRQRIVEYGKMVKNIHIIILSKNMNFEKRLIGANIFLYPTNSKNKFFYIFDAIRIGRGLVDKNKLEKDRWLVTTQDPFEIGFIGWFIAKTKGVRLQLQIHTDFMSSYFKIFFLNKIRSLLAMFLITQADCVRVVSERIRNSILKSGFKKGEKISILPIFIDVDKIKETELTFSLKDRYRQFDFIILTASRLEKEKNVFLMIEIMREIVKKYPKTGLIIIGEGSEKKSLRKLVLKNKLERNIIFENWQKDLVSYYKSADLFLATSNYEGYGMTLLEASISGCPVLTSDVGLVGDILKNKSIAICKVGNKKCFVNKLEEILNDKNILLTMSENAKRDVNERVISDRQKYLADFKENWKTCLKI